MILEKLRQATNEIHVALENETILRCFKDGSIDLMQYTSILQRFYGFFKPLESKVSLPGIEGVIEDFPNRRKAVLIESDLQSLGQKPREDMAPLPIFDIPSALGALYVIEGSTLGGMVISKILKDHLGISRENGGAYFQGYGKETASMWKSFVQKLQQYAQQNPKDEDTIIQGAVSTFRQLFEWMR